MQNPLRYTFAGSIHQDANDTSIVRCAHFHCVGPSPQITNFYCCQIYSARRQDHVRRKGFCGFSPGITQAGKRCPSSLRSSNSTYPARGIIPDNGDDGTCFRRDGGRRKSASVIHRQVPPGPQVAMGASSERSSGKKMHARESSPWKVKATFRSEKSLQSCRDLSDDNMSAQSEASSGHRDDKKKHQSVSFTCENAVYLSIPRHEHRIANCWKEEPLRKEDSPIHERDEWDKTPLLVESVRAVMAAKDDISPRSQDVLPSTKVHALYDEERVANHGELDRMDFSSVGDRGYKGVHKALNREAGNLDYHALHGSHTVRPKRDRKRSFASKEKDMISTESMRYLRIVGHGAGSDNNIEQVTRRETHGLFTDPEVSVEDSLLHAVEAAVHKNGFNFGSVASSPRGCSGQEETKHGDGNVSTKLVQEDSATSSVSSTYSKLGESQQPTLCSTSTVGINCCAPGTKKNTHFEVWCDDVPSVEARASSDSRIFCHPSQNLIYNESIDEIPVLVTGVKGKCSCSVQTPQNMAPRDVGTPFLSYPERASIAGVDTAVIEKMCDTSGIDNRLDNNNVMVSVEAVHKSRWAQDFSVPKMVSMRGEELPSPRVLESKMEDQDSVGGRACAPFKPKV